MSGKKESNIGKAENSACLKYRVYDRINLSVHAMDLIIGVCSALLAVLTIMGAILR